MYIRVRLESLFRSRRETAPYGLSRVTSCRSLIAAALLLALNTACSFDLRDDYMGKETLEGENAPRGTVPRDENGNPILNSEEAATSGNRAGLT